MSSRRPDATTTRPVAPALGPRVRSTLPRPLESVPARAAPNRPLVPPRATPSPVAGPPVVSRAWNTRGSVGRVPTEPCCPTPETNPVSVVDRGRRGEATATGAGATGGATTRRAASADGRRTTGERARAARGAGGAASARRAQGPSARTSPASAPRAP